MPITTITDLMQAIQAAIQAQFVQPNEQAVLANQRLYGVPTTK